eukprot:2184597-Amphidinium_carterae.1
MTASYRAVTLSLHVASDGGSGYLFWDRSAGWKGKGGLANNAMSLWEARNLVWLHKLHKHAGGVLTFGCSIALYKSNWDWDR